MDEDLLQLQKEMRELRDECFTKDNGFVIVNKTVVDQYLKKVQRISKFAQIQYTLIASGINARPSPTAIRLPSGDSEL